MTKTQKFQTKYGGHRPTPNVEQYYTIIYKIIKHNVLQYHITELQKSLLTSRLTINHQELILAEKTLGNFR